MVLVPVPHRHSKHHQAADPGADRGCASATDPGEIVDIVAGEVVCNAPTGDSTGGRSLNPPLSL